jgi:hypothetical protein
MQLKFITTVLTSFMVISSRASPFAAAPNHKYTELYRDEGGLVYYGLAEGYSAPVNKRW